MSGDGDFTVTSDWGTEPNPPQDKTDATPPKISRSIEARVALGPAALLAVISLISAVVSYVPELLMWDWFRTVLNSLAPLSAVDPQDFSVSANSTQVLALAAAILLAALAFTATRAALPVIALSVVGHVAFLVVALGPLLAYSPQSIPALVLGALSIGMALRAVVVLKSARLPLSRPDISWPVVAALTGALPLGIGRRLLNDPLRLRSTAQPLNAPMNLWIVAVGVSVIFGVWAVIALLPPYRGKSLFRPVLILVVAAVFGFGYAFRQVALS